HWPPLSVLHPSLPIPPLASTQCPPPLSANPSTGLHSLASTPLCQSLHWPPLSVLHPSLPIPPLASTQCPPPLSANPSTGLHSVSSTPLCQSLHWPPLIPPLTSHCPTIKFKTLTITYEAIYNSAPNYITNLVSKYHPNCPLRSSHHHLLLSSSLVFSSHAHLQDFS
ncbi:unnamed protein product, partial [Staurois parvus]